MSKLSPGAQAAINEALDRLGSCGPLVDFEITRPLDDLAAGLSEAEFVEIVDYCMELNESQSEEDAEWIADMAGEIIACRIWVGPETAMQVIAPRLSDAKQRSFLLAHLTPQEFEGNFNLLYLPEAALPFLMPIVDSASDLEWTEVRSIVNAIASCKSEHSAALLEKLAARFSPSSDEWQWIAESRDRWKSRR